MQTLPDFLAEELRVLSIGLNPSLPSVKAGYYFANPRNRFWRALNESELLQSELSPNISSHTVLLQHYRFGFTDVVKRATATAKDLHTQDYRRDVPGLIEKIAYYRPMICWFHGKVALRNTLLVADIQSKLEKWGLQPFKLQDAAVFMSPNPSSANAVFSVSDLVDSYNQLAKLINRSGQI